MPVVLLLMVSSLGAIAFTLVGVIVVRPFVRRRVGGGHNDVLSAVFQTGGTIYAVFLAFLVVAVWEAHDAAHDNIAEEASLLSTLYRGSTAMEPGSGDKLRALIRQYTKTVIAEEWPLQARSGGASQAARAAGLGMFHVFRDMPPDVRRDDNAVDQMELGLIAQLQADRNKRTLQASESVSPVIWSAAIANGVLVITMSFFLYADRIWPQIVICSVLATMISMLLCVVFVLERPFGGLMPLQPEAFAHSLDVYDSVDRTR